MTATTDTRYDAQTAVIVVDMQNDFGDKNGSLYVQGGEDTIAPINALVDDVLAVGGKAYYTQDFHPAETPHFIAQGGLWPPHGVQGTPGAELLDGLVVRGPIVQKGTDGRDGYSGFSVRDPQTGQTEATVLDGMLRKDGISKVIVVGLAGDYCVSETAIDAARLGFDTTMPLDLTRFVNLNPGDDTAAIERAEQAGVQVTR